MSKHLCILVVLGSLKQEASFALEVGQMSGIVDSDSGSHIIMSAYLRITMMKTAQFRGVLCQFQFATSFLGFLRFIWSLLRNCMSVRLRKVYNYFISVSGCSKKTAQSF